MKIIFSATALLLLLSCSAVKLPETNQYQLSAYSVKQWAGKPSRNTLLVTPPEAAPGYETNAMRYIKKPYQLETFAKNAWASPPADMLEPLLVQSLQRSGRFYAVSSGAYTQGSNYRLDTEVLSLQQNFLTKPSVLEFSVKVVLTHVDDNKVLASRIISKQIPCPTNTPYGGVIAANRATQEITATVTDFVMSLTK